jgi:hypothetical protein
LERKGDWPLELANLIRLEILGAVRGPRDSLAPLARIVIRLFGTWSKPWKDALGRENEILIALLASETELTEDAVELGNCLARAAFAEACSQDWRGKLARFWSGQSPSTLALRVKALIGEPL